MDGFTGGSKRQSDLEQTDSTSLKYGPTTSLYMREVDWFENKDAYYALDTSILFLHRYNFVARDAFQSQGLGTVGAAIGSIFPEFQNELGASFGLNSVNAYGFNSEDVKYYDTQSPLSDWYYAQGGEGRAIIDINMAQSIKPNWSAGFQYRRTNSRLIVGPSAKGKTTNQATHQSFVFHMRYLTPNQRYKFLGHMNYLHHDMNETGGIYLEELLGTEAETFGDLFDVESGRFNNRLTDTKVKHRRLNLHAYQQFALLDTTKVQLFHILDRKTYNYEYIDNAFSTTNQQFYQDSFDQDKVLAASDSLALKRQIASLDNKIGLKGSIGSFFYAGYYRLKSFRENNAYKSSERFPLEIPSLNTYGLQLKWSYKDLVRLGVESESSLDDDQLRMSWNASSKFGEIQYKKSKTLPSQVQQFYLTEIFEWNNDGFENIESDQLKINLTYDKNDIYISPFFERNTITNYTYFDTLAAPQQFNEALEFTRVGLDFNIKLWHIRQVGKFIYTQNDQSEVLRLPEYFANYTICFEKPLFRNLLFSQIGFDFHWKSTFFANAYMPVTQQFYLQNQQELGDYLHVDFFFNYRVNRVRMFLKVANVAQGLFGKGYFSTPNYMGQGRQFEFGIHWLLFD